MSSLPCGRVKGILLALILLFLAGPCSAFQMTASPASARPGEKVTVTLTADLESPPVQTLGVNLSLPSAVAVPVAQSGDGLVAARSVGNAASAAVIATDDAGLVNVTLFRFTGTFKATGPLVQVDFTIPADAAPGTYPITLTDPFAGDENGSDITLETKNGEFTVLAPVVVPPKPGDVNGDGSVNVTDSVLVLRHIVGLNPLSADAAGRADVAPLNANGTFGDGNLDVQDAIRILRRGVGLEPDPWPGAGRSIRPLSGRKMNPLSPPSGVPRS